MENTEAMNKEVAEFLNARENQEKVAKVEEVMAANPEIRAMVEKAENEDDMYAVFKKFFVTTLEDFKKLFHSVADYFKSDKTELPDEALDQVVGGWSFSSFWNRYKSTIISATIAVVAVAAIASGIGAVVGAVTTASGVFASTMAEGALVGAIYGAIGGTALGTALAVNSNWD